MKKNLFTALFFSTWHRCYLAIICVTVLLLSSCTSHRVSDQYQDTPVTMVKVKRDREVRGVWFSYLEMHSLLANKTEEEFTRNIALAFENVVNMRLNTVYVQVRPFSDALYRSKIFPWSYIVTGQEGGDPGFDPLAIMVNEAHKRHLFIEAWINPYRVRSGNSGRALAAGHPIKKWMDAKDRSVVQYGSIISLNPANPKAQNLIVEGVKEIVQKYNVDGIHIDDYFYPYTGTAQDKTFDRLEYEQYRSTGGSLTHAEWRRMNIETLLQAMYKGIKSVNRKTVFGISPQSSLANNYQTQSLDVEKIVNNVGFTDYIAPQIYFGFENERQPYQQTLQQWDSIIKNSQVGLYVGIASYKVGLTDQYAGRGQAEWQNNTDIIKRMILTARKSKNYRGFILYRYDHVFRPDMKVKSYVDQENRELSHILK